MPQLVATCLDDICGCSLAEDLASYAWSVARFVAGARVSVCVRCPIAVRYPLALLALASHAV